MILRYAYLSRHPTVFLAMTGLRVAAFDTLVAELLPGYAVGEHERLTRPDRQRAIGTGHPFALRPRDRLPLAVVWLRQYPTHEVLGDLCGVSDTAVTRTLARWLPLLDAVGRATMRLPDPGRKRRRHLDALLADTPALAMIVDTFEQRVQRPRDRAAADRRYSGKKQQHTLKSQLAIDEVTGAVVDVSDSVPGPTADITRIAQSGVLARLPPGVEALGDLGYPGLDKLHPQSLGAAPGASRTDATAHRRMSPPTAPSPGGGSRSSTPSGRCAATTASARPTDTIAAITRPVSAPWRGWSTAASGGSRGIANGSPRDPRVAGVGACAPPTYCECYLLTGCEGKECTKPSPLLEWGEGWRVAPG